MNDPLGDMLTRIRNAQLRRRRGGTRGGVSGEAGGEEARGEEAGDEDGAVGAFQEAPEYSLSALLPGASNSPSTLRTRVSSWVAATPGVRSVAMARIS